MIQLLEKARKKQIVLLTGLLGVWIAVVAYAGWRQLAQSEHPETAPPLAFQTVRALLPQEPTTDVPVSRVQDAWNTVQPAEMVLGVALGGEARAYPLNLLLRTPAHKVLNDSLGGQALVVTF
jgi:hypothetical protein